MPSGENQADFDFSAYLAKTRNLVEGALDAALGPERPESLRESMRYSLLAGGKRLRPILCLAACELVGGDASLAMPTAVALEMIHTMSLIHDDLPAMDNDDLRRGRPTNHKVYGDAMAILAGDALLSRAFEMVSLRSPGVPPERLLKVVAELALVSGAPGLVGGQVVDLESEGREVDLETLEYIHLHKTAALLRACVVTGALIGGADANQVEAMRTYANGIGLAFQIVDDLLDVEGDEKTVGKKTGKDAAAGKATFVSLLGPDRARDQAELLVDQAGEHLDLFGKKADSLKDLANFVIQREA